jgi:hypothetical protein
MGWHVLNIVIVPDDRISIDSVLVSLLESFSKLSGIFIIKKQMNSKKAAFFFSVTPRSPQTYHFQGDISRF